MYSYGFERIAGSIIQTLHEVNEQTKATWALPYWDYWGPAAAGEHRTAPFQGQPAVRVPRHQPPQRRAQPAVRGEAQPSRPKKDAPPPIRRVAINRGDRLPREVTSPHRAR
jgi:hypothetical protein